MKVLNAKYLEFVKELLSKQSVPSQLTPKAIDGKIDSLFVPFEGTNIGLTMTYITPETMQAGGTPLNVGLLQFHVAFPTHSVEKNHMAQVSEFVHHLNLLSPLPGWALDRENNAIHYRYVHVDNGTPPEEELLTYIMHIISFYMTRFVPVLVQVCLAKVKLEEAIKQIQSAE